MRYPFRLANVTLLCNAAGLIGVPRPSLGRTQRRKLYALDGAECDRAYRWFRLSGSHRGRPRDGGEGSLTHHPCGSSWGWAGGGVGRGRPRRRRARCGQGVQRAAVWKDRNWRYRELLESHHQPGDERGEGSHSGEPPGPSGYDPPVGGHYPHDGYDHGYYGYNHGYYDANHRHNYCHHGHDGCANRDDHHRRYHIAGGYYSCAEHHGGADEPLPVHRLPDG